MSSSVIMNPYSVQTFDLYPLRFCMLARKPFPMPRGRSSNLVRGRFGMALREGHAGLYQRWFAPRRTGGPSGLLDSPEPSFCACATWRAR